jgi:hypothetical protein
VDPLAVRQSRPLAGRSELALHLALLVYSVIAALVLVRLILLALSIDQSLWIGSRFLRYTDPVADALSHLPGADRAFLGNIALPDLTLAALLALVPIGMIARGRRGNH